MHAVVLDRFPGSPRLVDDWPEPTPGADDVIVQVTGVGICGSDLALVTGDRRPPSVPWVLGHETVGRVVATGPDVDRQRLGQRIVLEPNIPCLACAACRSGATSACPKRASFGFTVPGTLTERIAVPAAFAWPVPDTLGDADAVCVEPLSVAFSAIRRARLDSGSRCLVIGAGSQGALLCLALAAQGIVPYVLEPHPGRRALAVELGAHAIDSGVPGRTDPLRRPERSDPPPGADRLDSDSPRVDGFDVVFETSGAPSALAAAVRHAAAGGEIVLIGQSGRPAPLTTREVVQRQLTLRGSLIYEHPRDFAETLRRVGTTLSPGRVLRACYPLRQAAAAFRAAREVPGKTWIRLDG